MKKIFSFLEAILFSMANFAIIFYFGTLKDFDFVYYYGIAQTSALVLLSFYRNFLLLKLSSSASLHADSIAISFLLAVLVFCSCMFEVGWEAKLFFTVIAYNIVYESARYQVGVLVLLSKVLFFLTCGLALFFALKISRIFVVYLMLSEIFLCLIILLAKHPKFYRFINISVLAKQDFKMLTGLSVSQIGIVHLPFFYLSIWCSKNSIAELFIYRSAFQLVQIILRSLEIKNSAAVMSGNYKFNSMRKSFTLTGIFFGIVSISCFWIFERITGKSLEVPLLGFFVWYAIFIIIGFARFYDIHVHKSHAYLELAKAYCLGTITSFSLAAISGFTGLSLMLDNPSLIIFFGWFSFAFFAITLYKDVNREG